MNDHYFPHIFAITTRRNHGHSVWVFDAVPLHHYPSAAGGSGVDTYRVSAHVTHRSVAFYAETDIPSSRYNRVTLLVDSHHPHDEWTIGGRGWGRGRDSDIHSRWRFTGTMIYCMTLPEPIPLIELENGEELLHALATSENELRVREGNRHVRHVWSRRWDMMEIEEEIAEEERRQRHASRRRVAVPVPVAGPVPVQAVPVQQQQQPTPIPKFVADLIIADAVAKAAACPITMEPLKIATAAVTTCFHVFDANAIASWLASDAGNGACAVCRTPTAV